MSKLRLIYGIWLLSALHNYLLAITVVLDPAGDTNHPGRIIEHSYERTITLQLAQEIKKYIEQHDIKTHVYITRRAGEHFVELQQSQFSNRISADIFIHIQCYATDDIKPAWGIYYTSDGKDFNIKQSTLCWYPYDKAHEIHKDKTISLANLWVHTLTSYSNLCIVKGPYGLPLKPLMGVIAPAFLIEIGLKQADDWQLCVMPLSQSIIDNFST